MADIMVTVNGVSKEFPEGVSLESVYREMDPKGPEPILAMVNGTRLRSVVFGHFFQPGI